LFSNKQKYYEKTATTTATSSFKSYLLILHSTKNSNLFRANKEIILTVLIWEEQACSATNKHFMKNSNNKDKYLLASTITRVN